MSRIRWALALVGIVILGFAFLWWRRTNDINLHGISIARTLAEVGDIDGAKNFVSQLDSNSYAYCAIAETQATHGKIADAQATADLISDSDTKQNAEESIAEAQAKAVDVAGAKKVIAADTDNPTGQVLGYAAIAEIQAKAGHLADAQTSVVLAKAAFTHVPSELKSDCLDSIAVTEFLIGDVDRATDMMNGIYNPREASEIFEDVAEHEIQAGHYQAALDAATNITTDLGKIHFDMFLADAQIKAGNTSAAKQTLETAIAPIGKAVLPGDQAHFNENIGNLKAKLMGASAAAAWARAQTDPVAKVYALMGVAEGVSK